MQKLTKAEEQMMQLLWKLEKAFLKEIIDAYPEPKPKKSTISTVLRILEEKGFIRHESFGKSFQYIPTVSKDTYAKFYFGSFLHGYFEGSFQKLLNFFYKEGDISTETLDALKELSQSDPSSTEEDHDA
ncbi:MAG: BlaI/MecI/CopY family transcriptional regulator [Bacteroidota bacterium]